MKKLSILPAVLCLLLLTACGGLYHGAYLAESSGSVALVRDGEESELTSAQKGLRHKDAVVTAAQSSARIRLDGGKEIVLAAETEVGLFDSGNSCMLELRAGSMLTRLDKPLKTAETFEVTMGSLAVSTRDATGLFSLQWLSAKEALVNVYQGRAAVVSGRNGGELITVSAGETIRFDPVDATLRGEAEPIDFASVPEALSEYVKDYDRTAAEIPGPTPGPEPEEEPAPEETPAPEGGASAVQPVKPGVRPAPSKQPDPQTAPAPPADADGDEPDAPKDDHTDAAEPAPDGSPDLPEPEASLPTPPAAELKCRWDGGAREFQLYLNVTWSDDRAHHIDWQLCDAQGAEMDAGGSILAETAVFRVTDYPLDVASPENAMLWPQGCTLRLTPYYTAEAQSDHPAALAAVGLELPYLTLSSERAHGKKIPVIETNIGFWFEHDYSALTVETGRKGQLRVTGDLYPLEGEHKPFPIDVREGE